MTELTEAAKAYVETLFAADAGGHDVSHTLRVYRTAVFLAEHEGADPVITGLAALLHDADDIKLSPGTHASKTNAVSFLREHGVPEETVGRIVKIIEEVSFRGTDSVVPSSVEGMCVQDADRLDAIGAVGIARAFAYGGSKGRKMYDPAEPPGQALDGETYRARQSCTVNHFYEKLFLLKDMMNTGAAKRLAEDRDRFMRAFLKEFLCEWNAFIVDKENR